MVQNDDFVLFVAILEQLWDYFILLDFGARETEGFLDVKLLVLINFSKINQQEVSLDPHW